MIHVNNIFTMIMCSFGACVLYNLVRFRQPRFVRAVIFTIAVTLIVSFITNSRYVFLF